ncbi:S1/P1 nuclease [Photobacterium nomapromontoriensis]|uniref:S1/P1 nuclease n=1 Tax=Photobacterium nomapromontoriensis TaxID=2910237 RepID=UPI003D12E4A4
MVKQVIKLVVLAPLIFASTVVQAWNFQGHVIVAEIAYQNLTPKVREKVDALSAKAYQVMPKKTQRMMGRYDGVSQFARLAIVPDMIRKQPAQRVWKEIGETMPLSLNQWDDKKTSKWHYINEVYPATSQCDFVRKPNIKLATSALYTDFKQQPQAATMMFLSHMVGDAHQPMHSVATSMSRYWCKSDLGGNKYILDVPEKDLHHLWDNGLGLLEKKHDVDDLVVSLQHAYPVTQMDIGTPVDINQWLAESYQLADLAYSVKVGAKPAEAYYQQGKEQVKQRLALAGYRLADALNAALGEKD